MVSSGLLARGERRADTSADPARVNRWTPYGAAFRPIAEAGTTKKGRASPPGPFDHVRSAPLELEAHAHEDVVAELLVLIGPLARAVVANACAVRQVLGL